MKSSTMKKWKKGICAAMALCMAVGTWQSPWGGGQESVAYAAEDAAVSVTSPEGSAQAGFWLDEAGVPMYKIRYNGKEVVEDSAMGFQVRIQGEEKVYKDGFALLGIEESEPVDTIWENPFGDRKTVPDRYQETRIKLQAEDGFRFDILCRAYEEGVAFRYVFPRDEELSQFQILQELTYFNLDNEATAYVHKGRNQTEVTKIPVPQLQAESAGYFRPMTVIGDGYAMAITEANQVDYTRVHFTVEDRSEPGTLRTVFNGYTDNVDLNEENRVDQVTVDVSQAEFATSWRTFVLGEREGDLVERHYLVQNLNPECALEDTSWITPGMAVRAGLTTQKAKMAIDFAVEHHMTYVHFDAGWYGPEGNMSSDPWKCIDGFDLDEISEYADQFGIRLVLYINYRHLENEYQNGRLDDLFAMYKEAWGIDGIKFGFVPVGSQSSTKMVYEWVKIAADHQMIVDIHDEMLTTGYDRTYPNLLTYEAIHGDEENPTPKDDLGYLFTRMVAGQADHTWCFNRNDRNTTKAFRIAGSLVYFSPLIYPYWYDDGSLGSINDPATGMWDRMPTTWDESHMLDAKIEEHASVARRNGEDWYIAAISAADWQMGIPLDMLEKDVAYKAEIYTNSEADSSKVSIFTYLVDSADTLRQAMRSNSGYAARITKAAPEEIQELPRYSQVMQVAMELTERIEELPEVTAENLIEVEASAKDIREAYQQLQEAQKLGVSNIQKLERAEANIYRLRNCPVKTIYVNGEELEEFTPEQTEYEITLLGGAEVPYITCEPYEESRIVEIRQAQEIPGSALVTVKNDFTEKTYQLSFGIPSEAAEIYASDYTDYTLDGRKEYKVDTDRGGGALTLYNGQGETETFEKGVGTHANTNIFYRTEGKGVTRFQAVCGVSANNGKTDNKVRFKVYKDQRTEENLLFDSGSMTQKSPYQVIDVDVTGASMVILEANDGGDGISNDHANWCDAKFILGEVFTTPIDRMIEAAEAVLGQIQDEPSEAVLEAAIHAAEQAKTPESGELTYEEVYRAAIQLRDTLLEVKSDWAGDLKGLIEEGKEKQETDYTEASYQAMLKALTQAQLFVDDVQADLAELQTAARNLKSAIENLEEVPPADEPLYELREWIDFMEGLSGEAYTSESWALLQAAIEAAKEVEANGDATQAEMDQAVADMVKAFGALEYGVQKQHLEAAVKAAEDILALEQEYDGESLGALKGLMDEAKEMLANAAATQDEVNQMVSSLIDAIVQVAPNEELASLGSLLGAVEKLDGDKYTSDSWAKLQAAKEEAKAVQADPDRTEGALADAYLKLSEAIRGLVMRGNKEALDAVIEKAEQVLAEASKYSQSSISSLADVLEAAKGVYDDKDAVQAEVNKAVEELTKVLAQARLKGDVDNDGQISTSDATALLRCHAELDTLDGEALEGADVNGDGASDTKDAVLILQYVSEKITEF